MSSSSPRELDLNAVVEAVKAGRLSVVDAERQICEHAPNYAFPDAAVDMEEIYTWEDRCRRLSDALLEFFQAESADLFVMRVQDLGRVAKAAGRLLSPTAAAKTCYLTALHLEHLKAWNPAAEWAGQVAELAPEDDELAAMALVLQLACRAVMRQDEQIDAVCRRFAPALQVAGLDGYRTCVLKIWAHALGHLQRTAEAVQHAKEAIRLRRALAEDVAATQQAPELGRLYETLGLIHRGVGAHGEAIDAFERGRQAAQEAGDAYLAAWLLSEIGITWEHAGDPARGSEVLQLAIGEARAIGELSLAARWSKTAPPAPPPGATEDPFDTVTRADALLLGALRQPEEARQLYLKVLDRAKEQRDVGLEVHMRGRIAMCYDGLNQLLQAEFAQKEAIATARDVGMHSEELNGLFNLGNFLARRGKIAMAEKVMREAIALGEQLRQSATSLEIRQTIAAGLTRAYEYLAFYGGTTVRNEGSVTSRAPDAALVLETGQRCRALNFSNWLRLGDGVEAAGDAELVGALLRYRAAEVALERAAMDVQVGTLATAEAAEKARASFDRAAAAAGIQRQDHPDPLPIDKLRQALAPGECLVDLLSISEGVSIACLASDGATAAAFVSWHRDERVAFFRGLARAAVRAIKQDIGVTTGQATDAFVHLEGLLRHLDDKLLHDLAKILRTVGNPSHVFIVPHRDLFQLPAWRLTQEGCFPQTTVSVLPATGALASLRQRRRPPQGPRLIFGDATGKLPYAKSETAMLTARGFQPCESEASELLRRLPEAAWIHFAGHGVFDAGNPYRSGLVVRTLPQIDIDPLSAPWDLGFRLFSVAQIIGRLHLPLADTVVLSACETGVPRLHPASEFTSLPASFLVAGARNVIASLWPAHDGAAAVVMQLLYEAFDGNAKGRIGQALALARRRLAAMPREEVVARLGGDRFLPPRDRPFDRLMYTDTFQHYGVG